MPNQNSNPPQQPTPLQTSVGASGLGAPQHTPTVPFQLYKDTASGRNYMWIGSRWY